VIIAMCILLLNHLPLIAAKKS